MKILTTQYSLEHKALEVYVSGCKGIPTHCKNCHNPETWEFNQGIDYKDYIYSIKHKLEDFGSLIEKIVLLGGEPMDQDPEELFNFCFLLCWLKSTYKKETWLFTRFELSEIPDKIKYCFDYIKCGKYDETKRVDDYIVYGYNLSSSNQNIFKNGIDY